MTGVQTCASDLGAGFGSTLVPALAIGGSWSSGSGIIARKLEFKDAYRRVSIVFRQSYPRRKALEAFAEVVLANLPNTVTAINATARKNKKTTKL